MNNDAQIEYWNGAAGQKWVEQSDRLDGMLQPFAEKVLEAAAIQSSERGLDVGCGAGALTLAATRASGSGALGVDVSEPLLNLARKRASDAGLPAQFEREDASQFSAAEPFDLMISRFGVMFFEDPAAAFANIRKQLRSGGRLAFMCWQAFPINDWAFAPLQAAMPLLKELPEPPEPHAPGPFAFADKDRVARILGDAGWQNISIDSFETQMALPGDDVATSAGFMLEIGPLSRLIAAQDLDPEIIKNAVIERLSAEADENGRIAMKSACWLVRADNV